jgi:uncharacterized protein YfaS (alpha-2-macroglobulin family)
VLDRSLFRAGDTASMKIFVRKQTGAGFAAVARRDLEDTLLIRHQGSDREYTVPVRWNGSADGEAGFAIPKDAQLGMYAVYMRDSLPGPYHRHRSERMVGQFRVEAFRVPLMRARLQPVGTPLVNPADVAIDMTVNYLAGGGAGGLPVKLRTQLETRSVAFADFEGYAFAAGDVKEGRDEEGDVTANFGEYTFSDPDSEDEDADNPDAKPVHGKTSELSLSLDAAGGARATVKNIGKDVGDKTTPRDLVAELEYRDPNGETLTAATRVAIWPARVVLGLKPDSWAASKDKLKFTVAAVDVQGRPLAGTRIRTDAFRRVTYSHRRRLIGGFYAYEHGSETTRIGELCEGVSDAHGLVFCEVAAPAAGNLILRAQATDAEGNRAVTRTDAWVATGDDWWFAASDNDRVDLLPEKKQYEPGSTARFQVRTPFKEATVLVTIEREGVIESFVRTVKRSEPVIEIPIKGNYAPNVFVSALLVRGRIGGVAPTALIDLAKPAFKMGLAEIRVGWAAHQLLVKVTPDAAAYRVREKATVAIEVRRSDGAPPPRGSEVALAAVDEGLLELLPNDSWKLLDAMMTRRGEEVQTFTAQMQVIGKRHFGRKAVAAGGGGGRQSARELFDTLLLWKPRVALDDDGSRHGRDPVQRFAHQLPRGRHRIERRGPVRHRCGVDPRHAGLDAALRPAAVGARGRHLPCHRHRPQRVRAQPPRDALRKRRIETADAQEAACARHARSRPAAGETREVTWEMTAPVNATALDWQVDAVEGAGVALSGEAARDALKVSQRVVSATPERTFQATIFQLTERESVIVQRPLDAIPGRGGVNVRVQGKLAGDLPGVREYLSWYPYSCFEQRTSIAIGLRNKGMWDANMRALPDFLDRDGLGEILADPEGGRRLADRVRAVDRRRDRLADTRGRTRADGAGAGRLCRGARGALLRVADRGPGDP